MFHSTQLLMINGIIPSVNKEVGILIPSLEVSAEEQLKLTPDTSALTLL